MMMIIMGGCYVYFWFNIVYLNGPQLMPRTLNSATVNVRSVFIIIVVVRASAMKTCSAAARQTARVFPDTETLLSTSLKLFSTSAT